ncbi:MAG: hypothetical protein ACRD3W_25255, partial [Terriglobales bacterium]
MTVTAVPGAQAQKAKHLSIQPWTSHVLPLSVLLLIATAIFMPLFLHPHWGMYSDIEQIVQDCRIFYSSPSIRWDFVHGFYRPGFHCIDLLTWLVSRENPLGFYVVNWGFFCVTLAMTYLSSFVLSKSRVFSFVAAAFLFIASPTFEVIYTLDKGEGYVTCYLSILICAFLTVQARISNSPVRKAPLPR